MGFGDSKVCYNMKKMTISHGSSDIEVMLKNKTWIKFIYQSKKFLLYENNFLASFRFTV